MLYEFAWQSAMAHTGIRRNALYLVRPDGYVALSCSEQSAARLMAYLDTWARSEP